MVEDTGWDAVLLAQGEQTTAVDQVEWLAASELVAVWTVAGCGDGLEPLTPCLQNRLAPAVDVRER